MKDTHPLIAFCFFVAVISLTMCASHPVLAALSLAVSLAYLFMYKGLQASLRLLGLALLVLVVVVVFNAIFVHQGLTVAFRFMGNPVLREAIQYGFTLGCMLAAVLMWFNSYQEVVGSDRFLTLFSKLAPVSAMMVSMIFNFIPQILQKSRQINDTHRALAYVDKGGGHTPAVSVASAGSTAPPAQVAQAPQATSPFAQNTPTTPDTQGTSTVQTMPPPTTTLTGSTPQTTAPTTPGAESTSIDTGRFGVVEATTGPDWMAAPKRAPITEKLRWPVRLSSILMGWSMETGLATAASMRARAYGSARRSSYIPLSWTLRDAVLLSIMVVLFVIAIMGEFKVLDGFLFYPRMSKLVVSWAYLPYVGFLVSALIYEGGVRLKWRLSKF